MAGRSGVMIAVTWALVSGVAWCLASPLAPVPAALEPPKAGHNAVAVSDIPEVPQEKRLLKYLIPGGSSWVQQEGTKRGYNKNYLRFGRSEEEKRGGRNNFLRFGRGDSSSTEEIDSISDSEDSIEKRNRNFLRFGRDRNFLRFGRSDIEEFGLPGGPLAFANGVEDQLDDYSVDEKRARNNYLRFGRGNRNFLRFGRGDNRNFLRFGRSVDHELSEQKNHDANTTPAADAKTQETQRTKRSAGSYSYMAPAAWAQDYQPEEDEDLDVAVDPSDIAKRGYNRSFLRFGRNRNFLRFGKRSDEDSDEMVMVSPSYARYQRTPQRNFLRFG